MSKLLPHIWRAARIHDRMHALTNAREASEVMIEKLSYGLLWLDDAGRVLAMNPAAERLLARGDGLRVRSARLEAIAPAARKELDRAIADAIAIARGRGRGVSRLVRVERTVIASAYAALIAPIPRRSREIVFGFEPGLATVAVVVSDPEAPVDLSVDTLRRLFELTPTLARLALSIAEHADESRVTIGTARQQIKELLARTGARRQAEVIRMILTSVAQLERTRSSS